MLFPFRVITSFAVLEYHVHTEESIFFDIIVLLLICWIEVQIQIAQLQAQEAQAPPVVIPVPVLTNPQPDLIPERPRARV